MFNIHFSTQKYKSKSGVDSKLSFIVIFRDKTIADKCVYNSTFPMMIHKISPSVIMIIG